MRASVSAPNNKKALTRMADEGLVECTYASLYPPGGIPVMLIIAMLMAVGIINWVIY
jgi:hypothetical protein